VTRLAPFLLRPDDTVGAAAVRLRENGTGFGVVVGKDNRVLGTVADGAIRRAALGGGDFDAPVTSVMSPKPIVAGRDAADDEILELLTSYRIRALAVVEDDTLLGVRTLDEFPQHRAPAPVAVIMAGGRGQRLRPLTDKVPKPLLRIGPSSILERIISSLAGAGVEDVHLAVNYKANEFEKRLGDGQQLGVKLHYVRERQPLGTAGALSLLPELPRGPILVTNGDLVTTLDFARLFDFHWHHGGAVTIGGVEHLSHIPYGVLRTVEHHLLEIEEKPERRDFCSAGIYVLEPEVLRLVAPGARKDMPELVADVLAEGFPVHVFPVLETWFDIGSPAEFERVLMQFATGESE
jgi:dTDP-glucose pyrophosphorylase